MEDALFESLVEQLSPLTNMICLHVMGEPLFHPNLKDFLAICEKHKMPVSIVTNGVLLNNEMQEILLSPAILQVNFSLQSFEANYKGMDNKSYLEKIFRFTKKAFEVNDDIHIHYRLWNGENLGEALKKNELTISRIREAFDLPKDVVKDLSNLGNRLKGNLFLNVSENFDWPTLEMPFQSENGRCKAMKNQIAILSDGTVVPCCFDCEGVINLGDANKDSLVDILNSERAMKMFIGFQNNKLVEDLCQRCTYITRFKKENAQSYSKKQKS
jgi:radical SAM protein with 4Fe4S-binding SPASM domain